ncbi:WD40/YVTN/BNR-like repeat-containing protein [Paenibacillus sp. sgz500958]|uniref:WD40/YVTN/BNR-like repeat-containing protein n=1 Tax=Paenibacillus sp. sgz500958 TaxID=3242475 RepID=UPI0036D250DC
MPGFVGVHKYIRLLILALLTALAVAACSSPPPEPSPQPPQPTESPEEGQTITVITPDAANIDAENAPKYQIQTRLTDFELLSESKGIAWGVTKNSLRIYLTRDNGETWANISPSSNIQFTSNPVYGKDIFFKDQEHGWIVREAHGITETVVLRTEDGGQHWKISSLADGNRISSIFFISPERGWLMTSWNSTTFKESKALYSTINGGATWEVVMQNEQYTPITPNPSIPIPGVTTGMLYRDSNHGFASLQTGALPKIYTTSDGGVTWRQGQAFPVNDRLTTCDRVITGTPDFFGTNNVKGWISVGCQVDKDSSVTYHGYFTANGGANWKFVPFNLGKMTGTNRDIAPAFLNSTTGWILSGNNLYQTRDQGKSWNLLPVSDVLQSKLIEYPEVVKLQFFSEDLGWLLIEKKEDRRSILLQTINGGVSWRVM